MLEGSQPAYEIALAHFIVSDDVERSRRFYTEVLGGKTIRSGEPAYVALASHEAQLRSPGATRLTVPPASLYPEELIALMLSDSQPLAKYLSSP